MPKQHKLVLGFAHWGTTQVPITQMIETVTLAVKEGINEIDCAPHYGNGAQENVLGVALLNLSEQERKQLKISTKVGRVIDPDTPADSSNGFTNTSGFSQHFTYTSEGINQSFAQSQLRLGMSSVHALYLHDIDAATHKDKFNTYYKQFMESGYGAFDDLKREKKINITGIGSNDPNICAQLIKEGRFTVDRVMIAGCYNLLNFSALEELFPLCKERNIELYVAAPYGGGLLSNPEGNQFYRYQEASSELQERVKKIQAICTEFNVPIAHVAMQFVHMHPQVDKVVVGARTPEELSLSLKYATTLINPQLWKKLKKEQLIPESTKVYDGVRQATTTLFTPISEDDKPANKLSTSTLDAIFNPINS